MQDGKARSLNLAHLAACAAALAAVAPQAADGNRASGPITRPVVSEDACPLELIAPVARDGHRSQGVLRKPPGVGPFPVIVWIHGGVVTQPLDVLKDRALNTANSCRFLAAGYVIAVITYRSRDLNPQAGNALEDCLAAIACLRGLRYIDPQSIVVYGCSGGGDLALEVAAATDVCAIVPEEPASMGFTGIFNASFPKRGERYTIQDGAPILADPKGHYKPEHQRLTREKIGRIRCPILLLQGDQHPINRFNAEVLLPELRNAGKRLEVITYPGAPHCFGFPPFKELLRPAMEIKLFQDVDAFCRRYLKTKPKPLEPRWVKQVPHTPA